MADETDTRPLIDWVAVAVSPVLVMGMVGSLVFALLGQAQLFALAVVPMSLVFSTVFYVSLYFTFADCFVPGDPAPEPTAA